jgi:hypothetical protein
VNYSISRGEFMNLSTLYPEGTKVYSTNGQEFGVVQSTGDWACACGKKGKLRVRWPNGEITLVCPRGIESFRDGYKISG